MWVCGDWLWYVLGLFVLVVWWDYEVVCDLVCGV